MIISHKYRFIFIKTMKTAGSSIELHYGRHLKGPEDVLSKSDEDISISQNHTGFFNPLPELVDRSYTVRKTLRQFYHGHKFGPHQSARVVQNRIPKAIWDSYYKFCVERNPYDKMVSMFFMNWGKSGVDRPGKTFEDWVRRGRNLPVNYPLYSWNGKVIVDKVIRYENLNEELGAVYRELGVPFDGLEERAKGNYRKDRRSYEDFQTPYTREQTVELCRPEFELMGYPV